MSAEHDNHGQTPAAWTAVVIIIAAFIVGTVALIINQWWLFWAAVGLVVVGGIVGKVMQMMGLGAHPQHADEAASDSEPAGVS